MTRRSYVTIEENDLEQLGDVALATLRREFKRRRNYPEFDENELIGICLCQGAADHYLQHESRKSPGIKDFDLWAFFRPQAIFRFGNAKPAASGFGSLKFGPAPPGEKRFIGRRVDVFWRQIPERVTLDIIDSIHDYFAESEQPTACELRKRSAIIVWPWDQRTYVVWNPDQLGEPASYDPWE